jgi:hypothetical protein
MQGSAVLPFPEIIYSSAIGIENRLEILGIIRPRRVRVSCSKRKAIGKIFEYTRIET